MTLELAGRRRLVGAHPPQRRRVGVERDRGPAAAMGDAVDVRRGEVDRIAGTHAPAQGRSAERETLLDDGALGDRQRAAGDVVVVEARVVIVHPADEPDRDVLVAYELLVCAHGGVVVDEMAPRLRLPHEPGDERAQLGSGEVARAGRVDERHAATSAARSPSRRATFAPTIASRAAGPSSDGDATSTTGRSEPWTSWSMPTQRTSASIARTP